MYWLIAVMTLGITGMIVTGVIMEMRPAKVIKPWFKPTIGINLLLFVVGQAALIFMGVQEVMAAPAVAEAGKEISVGLGLGIIGVGIPTGLSTIGAGVAVGPIGAASLAMLAEKPELLGRTLIYLGLAEGIAIYGLIIAILVLNR